MGAYSENVIATRSNRFLRLPGQSLVLQSFHYQSRLAFPQHLHDEYSLVVCLEGQLTAEQRGAQECLHSGELVITSPGVLHASAYGEGGMPTLGLSISLSWFQMRSIWEHATGNTSRGAIPVFLGKQAWPGVRERAEGILKECQEQRPGYELIAEGYAYRLLADVVQWWPAELVSLQEPKQLNPLDRWQFVVAVETLAHSMKWKQSVEQLCLELDIGQAEFQTRFEDTVGKPMADCSRELVLNYVSEEILRGERNLAELARETGFRSANQLVGAFRVATSTTPRRLRSGIAASPVEKRRSRRR